MGTKFLFSSSHMFQLSDHKTYHKQLKYINNNRILQDVFYPFYNVIINMKYFTTTVSNFSWIIVSICDTFTNIFPVLFTNKPIQHLLSTHKTQLLHSNQRKEQFTRTCISLSHRKSYKFILQCQHIFMQVKNNILFCKHYLIIT